MTRSITNRLLKARDNGAIIVTKGGRPVEYDSQGARDDKPWRDALGNRYSGPECKTIVP